MATDELSARRRSKAAPLSNDDFSARFHAILARILGEGPQPCTGACGGMVYGGPDGVHVAVVVADHDDGAEFVNIQLTLDLTDDRTALAGLLTDLEEQLP